MISRSSWMGAAAAIGLLTTSAPAIANGRYPAAGQIAVDPGDPRHIVVRATYGVLTTSDGGARWSWICEGAIGFNSFNDPMMAITADGSMIAGLLPGLSTTHDRGCQWDFAEGPLAQSNVVDVSTERADPESAVLLTSSVLAGDKIVTQVWASRDNAGAWTQVGVDLPATFLGLTLDSAPSDPQQIYVSGRFSGPTFQGALQRTMNRGKSWESFPIPGSDDRNLPYIGAIDPKDPEIVYVRRDGETSDGLLVTRNGGATWKEAWTPASLLGLALSPDGTKIAAGSDKDGLWLASTATLDFVKVSDLHVRCLTWTSQGLFACADEQADGFTAGLSVDEGKHFSPFLRVDQICGAPAECGAASSTGKTCPPLWRDVAIAIGQTAPCGVPDGGTGGSGGGVARAAGSGGHGSGSACQLVGAGSAPGPFGLAMGVACAVARARRRRRKAGSRQGGEQRGRRARAFKHVRLISGAPRPAAARPPSAPP